MSTDYCRVRSGVRFNKKGAITLYIIIGIIILFIAIVLIFVATREAKVEIEKTEIEMGQLSFRAQPPISLVENCIRSSSRQALELMGKQGGWVSLTNSELSGETSLRFSYFPTESDGVEFVPGEGIPYWYYLESRSDCDECYFRGRAPSVKQMQAMIERFINKNLDVCINNFAGLENQYVVTSFGEAKTKATIAESNVIIEVEYPIEIEFQGTKFEHKDYFINIPVNLRKLHKIATEITNAEITYSFLEDKALSLISAYGTTDAGMLPPIGGTELGSSKVFWSTIATEQKLKDLIQQYSLIMTIPNSNNFYPFTLDISEDEPLYDIRQGALYGFVLDILEEGTDVSSVDANFYYLEDWPVYLDINPHQGDLLGPEETKGGSLGLEQFLPLQMSQSYRFVYDFSYPVVVELRDTDAFNGEGYSFMFALESNIRNNKAFRRGEEYTLLPELGKPQTNLFANPKQWISGEINVVAKDDNDELLPGVAVNYYCVGDSAYLGQTNDQGQLISRFPICNGGVVKLTKEGYFNSNIPFNTEVGVAGQIDGELVKIWEKQATIKVRDYAPLKEKTDSIIWTGPGSVQEYMNLMGSASAKELVNATVYLTLTKIRDNPFEEPFETIAIFDEDQMSKTIKLIPGRYEVKADYIDHTEFFIPPDTIEFEVPKKGVAGMVGGTDTERVELPRIPENGTMDSVPLGGAILDVWEVGDELKMKSKVEFYVLKSEIPEKHEDLMNLGNTEEMSEEFHNLIQPRWS